MIHLTVDQIENLKKDFESGAYTQRELSQKYGISQTKLRSVLGLGKQSKIDLQKNNRAIIKSRKKQNKELIQKVTVETVETFIKDGYVDVVEGIRQGLKDLTELNQEQRRAIPEMTNNLKEVLERIKETADPVEDKDLIKDVYKTLSEVSSFYLRGKLRIESQKEILNYLKAFKESEIQQSFFNHFQNCMDAVFWGLEEITDDQYFKFRDRAIAHYQFMKKYFDSYEELPG